jgi:hypothetical protein
MNSNIKQLIKDVWVHAQDEGAYEVERLSSSSRAGLKGTKMPEMSVKTGSIAKNMKLAWVAGFVVGFYAPHEREEVPKEELELFDAAIAFGKYWGFDDNRDEDSEGKVMKYTLVARKILEGIEVLIS